MTEAKELEIWVKVGGNMAIPIKMLNTTTVGAFLVALTTTSTLKKLAGCDPGELVVRAPAASLPPDTEPVGVDYTGFKPLTNPKAKLGEVLKPTIAGVKDGYDVYVEPPPPKPAGALQIKSGWEIIDLPEALPGVVKFKGVAPTGGKINDKFSSNIDLFSWEDFLTEVKKWDPTEFMDGPVQLPLWTNPRRKAKTEGDVSRAVASVLHVVADMTGAELGDQVVTSSANPKRKRDDETSDEDETDETDETGGTGELRRTIPDFTFSTPDEEPITVVEIKKPFVKGGSELLDMAKQYNRDSEVVLPRAALLAFATLQQLSTYFENSKVNTGVISDYEHFWFVRKIQLEAHQGDARTAHVILQVSDGLPCQSTAPTVLRALGYIVSLGMQDFEARKAKSPSDAAATFVEEKHLETDSKTPPSSSKPASNKKSSGKKGGPRGGKKGGPPAPMHSLGFGRCGRVLIAPSPAGPVAVKFVRERSSLLGELQHEAQMYQALAPLQGSVLPRLYHVGPVFDGKYFGLCLEPVGITVSRALALGVNRDFLKKAALDALDKLHAAKVIHGDIRDRNICYEPQTKRVRLIDLGFAAPLKDEHEAKEERVKMRSLFDRVD